MMKLILHRVAPHPIRTEKAKVIVNYPRWSFSERDFPFSLKYLAVSRTFRQACMLSLTKRLHFQSSLFKNSEGECKKKFLRFASYIFRKCHQLSN